MIDSIVKEVNISDDFKCSLAVRFRVWLCDRPWWRKLTAPYWWIPHDYRPHEIWYRFKCWAWLRYTTVKPRTLGHTWYDRSGLLPHVMFQILTDFLENEIGYPGPEAEFELTQQHEGRCAAMAEMVALYHWWHDVYLGTDPHGEAVHEWAEFCKAHQADGTDWPFGGMRLDSDESRAKADELHAVSSQISDQRDADLTANLIRLIKVREYMWT